MKIFKSKKKAIDFAVNKSWNISERNGKFIVKDNKLKADLIIYILVIIASVWLICS